METIIYFYATREKDFHEGVQPYRIERFRKERYCLIKIGLLHTWLEEAMCAEERIPEVANLHKKKRTLFRKDTVKQESSLLQELLQIILPFVDALDESYLVYEEPVKRTGFANLWNKYCPLPEFEDYLQENWSEPLLAEAKHPSYIILGFSYCLPEFLWQKGDRMKSICWVLQGKRYTEEVRELESAFYEEFGLAIDMRMIASKEDYKKVRLQNKLPVNVVDFSGEEKIQVVNLARGSVWLDMSSMEEKRRRIEERNTDISYFSLKKQWKQIDTISKNRYNT